VFENALGRPEEPREPRQKSGRGSVQDLEIDAHSVDSQIGAPFPSVLLLPVDFKAVLLAGRDLPTRCSIVYWLRKNF